MSVYIRTLVKLIRFLFAILAGALLTSRVTANIAHVTTVGATASTIIVPGANTKVILIQNTGSTDVRLSIDGGSTYTDIQTQKTGTDPTTTLGYLLKAGTSYVISTTASDSGLHKPIRAILVTSATTLEIVTDDYTSTFPTP